MEFKTKVKVYVGVLAVIGGGIGSYFIVKKVQARNKTNLDKLSNDNAVSDAAQKYVERQTQNGGRIEIKRTIDDVTAGDIANALYSYMKGFGSSADNIDGLIFKQHDLTPADVQAIYSAFGKKDYYTFGDYTTVVDWNTTPKRLTLIGWFMEELDPKEDVYIKLEKLFSNAGFNWNR